MEDKKIYDEDFSEAEEIIENEGDGHYTVILNSFKVTKDKVIHFAVCFLITLCVFFFGMTFGYAALGFGIAVALGFGKELFDKYIKKTYFDWGDIVFDIWGGCVGVIVSALVCIFC